MTSKPLVSTPETVTPDLRKTLELEYGLWLDQRGFEPGSVHEHLMWNHDLTDEDRAYLGAFIPRWEAMEDAEAKAEETGPTTDDVGIAVRDGLDHVDYVMIAGSETDVRQYDMNVDDSDLSNLRVTVGGALFRVSITRIG